MSMTSSQLVTYIFKVKKRMLWHFQTFHNYKTPQLSSGLCSVGVDCLCGGGKCVFVGKHNDTYKMDITNTGYTKYVYIYYMYV